MSYFNTTSQTGETLKTYTKKAETQDKRILDIYRRVQKLTAEQAWEMYCGLFNTVPLTSIRRAVTNLCDAGELIQTQEMQTGMYGRPIHVYRMKIKTTLFD